MLRTRGRGLAGQGVMVTQVWGLHTPGSGFCPVGWGAQSLGAGAGTSPCHVQLLCDGIVSPRATGELSVPSTAPLASRERQNPLIWKERGFKGT